MGLWEIFFYLYWFLIVCIYNDNEIISYLYWFLIVCIYNDNEKISYLLNYKGMTI